MSFKEWKHFQVFFFYGNWVFFSLYVFVCRKTMEFRREHITRHPDEPLIGMLAHAKLYDCIQLLAGKKSISKGNDISPRVW